MILRAIMALGSVWLLMPHNPGLGSPQPPAIRCDADGGCNIGAADPEREVIFQRLRAIRREIQDDGRVQDGVASILATVRLRRKNARRPFPAAVRCRRREGAEPRFCAGHVTRMQASPVRPAMLFHSAVTMILPKNRTTPGR